MGIKPDTGTNKSDSCGVVRWRQPITATHLTTAKQFPQFFQHGTQYFDQRASPKTDELVTEGKAFDTNDIGYGSELQPDNASAGDAKTKLFSSFV